jgi:hypothetical protein
MIEIERNDLEKLLQLAEFYLTHLYIQGIEISKEDELIKKMRFLLKEENKND